MTRDVILVTGASSDIGLALIRRLAAAPAKRLILAHCNSSRERIDALPPGSSEVEIVPIQTDFSSPEAIQQMAEEIVAAHGVPSQIVHLPGLKLTYERLTKFDWDRFETDLTIQVRAPLILLKRFLPAMAKLPSARVVFMLSSVIHGVPPRFMSMYNIVKHAQLGLMRSLASEYSESGIRINAVSPGMVDTRFLELVPDVVKEMSASASPRKRNATPDDVVGVIEFLLSPAAGYIHGVDLPVAGGAG